MEGRLLARARLALDRQRQRNRDEEYRRRSEIYAAFPEISDIDKRLRAIMTELVGFALGDKRRSVEDMERESLALQEKRAALLRQNGYDRHYLDEIVSCPLCRDSGNNPDGTPCSCLLALYKKEQTAELSPLLKTGGECFERFRLDYYSPVPLREGEPSPRSVMERIMNACRRYAEGFRPGAGNLLFTGAPGLGKTFLSASVARIVAASPAGYSVAYDTVSGLLSAFESEKFSRAEEAQSDAASRVRQLTGCDLLILDDLGTEMPTSFSAAALYSLLDGRLRGGRSTIISTNLTRDQITERYGAALASRLLGEYLWLEFLGRDIRAIRKEQN